MTSKTNLSEYTEAEIRQALREKLKGSRRSNSRLAWYIRTGRAVKVVPDENRSASFSAYAAIEVEEAGKKAGFLAGIRWVSDHLLLGVETLVLLAFIFVLVQGGSSLASINREAVKLWDLPALSPTPLIRAIVLPSGHTPPTSPGGTRPNVAEIPAHLRPVAQSYAYTNIPTPTPSPDHGVRIQIPAINIDAPVVMGDGWEQLKKGVAQRIGTPNPGQKGNMVLSGHNDVFGEVFRYLDRLKPGDEIIVYTSGNSYTYVVSEWFLVEPTQVDVMDPTPDATITLISCYPYLIDTERIIVKGKLLRS